MAGQRDPGPGGGLTQSSADTSRRACRSSTGPESFGTHVREALVRGLDHQPVVPAPRLPRPAASGTAILVVLRWGRSGGFSGGALLRRRSSSASDVGEITQRGRAASEDEVLTPTSSPVASHRRTLSSETRRRRATLATVKPRDGARPGDVGTGVLDSAGICLLTLRSEPDGALRCVVAPRRRGQHGPPRCRARRRETGQLRPAGGGQPSGRGGIRGSGARS